MADRDTEHPDVKPGRIRRLRNRIPAASVRVPLPAGMGVVLKGSQGADTGMPTSLANVLLSYLAAANTTTLYLEQKVSMLARALPGDEQENTRRLRPLARLAALPQRTATRLLLPPLQSRLPNPSELVRLPVRIGRQQVARAGSYVSGRFRGAPDPVPESSSHVALLLSLARTPVMVVVAGSLYSVSRTAYTVHGVAERLRLVVWRRL